MAEVPQPESRRALIRRMYHDERCTVGEIAEYLGLHRSDVFWALQDRSREACRRRRFSRWGLRVPVESGPLTPSIGLQVRA